MKHSFQIISLLFFMIFTTFSFSEEGRLVFDLGMDESGLEKIYIQSPSVQSFPPDEEFGMSHTKTIRLPSIVIGLHQGEKGFYVWRLDITGSGWAFHHPSIFIGAAESELEKHIGIPESKEVEDGVTHYFFRLYPQDSWVKISVKEGRVTKIFAAEDWT
ncbi:MAG: hypothetical protein V2I33_14180 [Kangiellaceae bacterium]|nr:hypothetical protein [Kangiellaceae bacterium]